MVQLEQLQIGYDKKTIAVQPEKIVLLPGSFTALIGVNGSGKSTLLRAITTGAHVLSGKVTYNECLFEKLSSHERALLISIVLTSQAINPALTVREMLEISRAPHSSFAGKLSPVDKAHVNNALEIFNCTDLINKRLHTLSDGQLQRALVARAIVQDTPFIFMDEPSSHLDINHKAQLLFTLKNYCVEKNKTILYASHEVEIALALSENIITIHNNNIVQHKAAAVKTNNFLQEMFPSKHLSFKDGKTNFHF